MILLLAGVAAAAAAALVVWPSDSGVRPWAPASGGSAPPGEASFADVGPSRLSVRLAGSLAGVAAWLLVGGWPGLVVGTSTAVGAMVFVARLEPAAVRRRRLAAVRAAPVIADLLAAGLGAGVPVERAVPVIARAFGGDVERALMGVHRRIELGEPPDSAWDRLADVPGLAGISRAISRSSRTGAPLATLLTSAAVELRAQATAAAVAEVRATAVRAVLPLGLCLLPAFVLLGIAPIVGGLLPTG